MKKAKVLIAFLMTFILIFNLGSALAVNQDSIVIEPQAVEAQTVEASNVTFDLLTINWIMRERVVAVVFDLGTEISTSELASDTFTVHCRNNNAAGVMQNQANRNIARIYANSKPEMLDPFQRDIPTVLPASGRYVVIELVFWPIAQATAASTGNDSIAFKQIYTVTQNKAFNANNGNTFAPGDVSFVQGKTINNVLDRFEYGQAKVGENSPTNYRLFRPDDVTRPQPLVVVQHGGGQGTDNECHLRFQNNSFFAWPEIQEEFPSYVLMPANCTTNAGFENIKSVIDEMIADGLVDSNRIYITGHSMGGSATWNFVLRYPDLFAAVAPLATAFAATYNEEQAAAIADLPIWEFTTQGDRQGTGAVNMNANWGPHLNNYKFTLLPHNQILEYKGMWYSTPGDANTPGLHGAWLIAYNYYGWNDLPEAKEYPHLVDLERGRLIDWMFAQSKNKAVEVTYDLLSVNNYNNEAIGAVAIDMGEDILASTLDTASFSVYARNRNPNGSINNEAMRNISAVYVSNTPEMVAVAQRPSQGRYLIIEMVIWPLAQAASRRVATDSTTLTQDYTVTQLKPIWAAAGTREIAPESVIYTYSGKRVNPLIDSFEKFYSGTTPYHLFTPTDVTGPQPLVLLMHGSGQGTNDDGTVLRFQNNLYFAHPEQQAQYKSYVMIPSAAPSNSWDAAKLDNLKAAIDGLIAAGKVDPTRIYITGASMGGGGTWSFIQRYPELFAAAVPICAGGSHTDASIQAIKDLPIWFFITRHDGAGLWNGVMASDARLKAAGATNYKLTIFEDNYHPNLDWYGDAGSAHAAWRPAYNVHRDVDQSGSRRGVAYPNRAGSVIDWMFSQQRSTDPKDTGFDLVNINWVNHERVAAIIIDLRKEAVGSSLDSETFDVDVSYYNFNTGAAVAGQSNVKRNISKVYVNTEPAQTSTPPASGQYLIIELNYWPLAVAASSRTASDSVSYRLNYTVTQKKAFTAFGGAIEPGDLNFKQRKTINDLIDQFIHGYAKAANTTAATQYRLYSPEVTRVGADASKRYPLVVLLHGGGQGSDNEAQMRFQNNLYFAWPEIQAQFPSYVLLPASGSWNNAAFDNIKALIDRMVADGRVDPTRIYITGSSMGGGGTWSFLQRYPNLFAAAIPICAAGGISSVDNAKALADLPIWAFVTRGDSLYTGNLNTYRTYSQYMNNYKFTTFEDNYIPSIDWYGDIGSAHAAWLRAYNEHSDVSRGGKVINWLFAQQRSTDPKDTDFDLLTINWEMRERVTTVAIDMRKEVIGSSLDNETFTVHALLTNPRTGATMVDADRIIKKVYVNSVPKASDNPPASGQYLIIELVYWPIAQATGASTANDSVAYDLDYSVIQNKVFQTAGGAVSPGDLNYKQRLIKNDLIDRFVRGQMGGTKYSLFTPNDTSKKQPLVLLLHGGGQGADNETQLRFQNNLYFAWPETQEEFPSYVLLPAAGGWGNSQLDDIKSLIDRMIADGRVDPDRIYVTGSSMGGGGTWAFIQRYPDLFAAAVPICSGGSHTVASVQGIANLPIWLFVTKGDFTWASVMNTHNNWSQYLNDYKLTIFEENYIPQLDWTFEPHAAWLMAYNVNVDSERGRTVSWMFAQSKNNKAVQLALEDLKAEIATGKYSVKSVAAAQLVVDEVETALTGIIPKAQVPAWLEKIANAKNQLVLKVTSLVTGTVSVVSIRKGKALQLDPEWAPDSVNALEIQYSSSNVSVASVSATGQIIAVKPGMAVITLKALDGSGLTTQVLVTVTM